MAAGSRPGHTHALTATAARTRAAAPSQSGFDTPPRRRASSPDRPSPRASRIGPDSIDLDTLRRSIAVSVSD